MVMRSGKQLRRAGEQSDRKVWPASAALAVAIAAATASAPLALANTDTWTGGGADANWSTDANWSYNGTFTTTLLAPASYTTTSSNTSATQVQSGTLQIGTGGSLPTLAAGGTFRTNAVALGSSGNAGVLVLGDAGGAMNQTIDNLAV